jgi:hypothetical protein
MTLSIGTAALLRKTIRARALVALRSATDGQVKRLALQHLTAPSASDMAGRILIANQAGAANAVLTSRRPTAI